MSKENLNTASSQTDVIRRMKRTCNGCRAFDYINSSDKKCSLGFQIEYDTPLELCPKPKTINQLIHASKFCV